MERENRSVKAASRRSRWVIGRAGELFPSVLTRRKRRLMDDGRAKLGQGGMLDLSHALFGESQAPRDVGVGGISTGGALAGVFGQAVVGEEDAALARAEAR